MCDLSPKPLLRIAGHKFPARVPAAARALSLRHGRVQSGLGARRRRFRGRAERAGARARVHLGGTLDEIAASERGAWNGETADRPFVLLSQPTLFDPSRAPAGRHMWRGATATCRAASTADMLDRIEQQIERFAPGFRDCVLARSVMTPADIEAHNANLRRRRHRRRRRPTCGSSSRARRGGPTRRRSKGLYICSASTPPGVGVHGMCGYSRGEAAR